MLFVGRYTVIIEKDRTMNVKEEKEQSFIKETKKLTLKGTENECVKLII